MRTLTSDMHKKQTRAFIEQNPNYLVLHRATKVADGAGGIAKTADVALDPQWVRVVHQIGNTMRVLADGTEVQIDKSVVGLEDLDVAIEDVFLYDNQTFRVVKIHSLPGWRVVAEAIHNG